MNLSDIINSREKKLNSELKKYLNIDINNYDTFFYRMKLIKNFLLFLVVVFLGLILYNFIKTSTVANIYGEHLISLLMCIIFYQIINKIIALVQEKEFIKNLKNKL